MSSNLAPRVFLVCSFISSLCLTRVEAGHVGLAWNPSTNPTVAGYFLHCGLASHNYTATLDAGDATSIIVERLDAGATYFFAVSAYSFEGAESRDSDEISVTIPFPPVIIFEPSSQTAQAGTEVVISVDAVGTPPLTFQWFNGVEPIIGGASSILKLDQISDSDAGNYTVVVNDPAGSVTSAVATVTVVDFPSDVNTLVGATGTPLRPIEVSSNDKLLASPIPGASIATAAGTYNGLFYQTDDGGMPAITRQTAGLLTQCLVDTLGNYTGVINIDGLSSTISGAFDAAGNGSATVDRAATGLSDLLVTLQLDLTAGASQMTGSVSNLDQENPWTAALTAELETNAFAQPPNFVLLIPPINGLTGGFVTGVESDGAMSLFGMLGDGTTFLRNAPVSANGAMPMYIQLYGKSGLLAGWVNVFGSPSTSLLTWIRPSGPARSGFTNIVEVPVTPIVATTP